MPSTLFKLNSKDLVKGLVVAILSGVVLPVAAMLQTPGFDITTANWHGVITLALNGAASGFLAYIVKNFFSDDQGLILGKI